MSKPFERVEVGVEVVPCRKHTGGWYGGPGLWCGCGTQDCGYCGSYLVAHPTHEADGGLLDYHDTHPDWFHETERVVIALEDLQRAFDGLLDDPTAEAIWRRLGGD